MQLDLQSSLLTDLEIKQKSSIFEKPDSWPDIRKNTQNGHIYLLADMRYPLGFTATVTGGYSVNIDGEHYADYNSQAQFSMSDWSEYTDTEGYTIDYPTNAVKAHIIDIYPQTTGNNITAFKCSRVAASGTEEQGVLWAHFNLDNAINLGSAFGFYGNYKQTLMEALTAKNNIINCTGAESLFFGSSSLAYSPILDFQNAEISLYGLIWNSAVKTLKIKNVKPTSLQYFANNSGIEKLKFVNCDFSKTTTFSAAFNNATNIKILPDFNFSTPCLGGGEAFVNNCSALTNDVILDLSNCTALNKFIATSTSKFKGLRVSTSVPFSGAAPQINVSNTGMDRTAIVQLFNDLPTVTGGQIINITGCSGTADLTDEDKAIATYKGWTIAE